MADGLFKEAYKKLVPSNARTLIDTALGSSSSITEKDFSKEELDILKQMYSSRKTKNSAIEESIRKQKQISKEQYAKDPEITFDGKGGKKVLSYGDYQKQLDQQLKSFEDTRSKTSVSYLDYPDKKGAPTFDSWLDTVWKSYTDPQYRLKTILGSFNVKDTPEGKQVTDLYNFDNSDFYKAVYKIDPSTASIGDIYSRANGPIDFLDMMMIKKFPKAQRKVEINLEDQDIFSDPFKPTIK